MGKKTKRKVDVFYKRAKIAGYRARSAYKLLQIENKFQVLQGSRVCIDLCAAPGSWMQVAKQTMPLSSIIIGVDLYPIKNIHGTVSIQGDITTEKVRQELKAKLTTWKADVILHDGAPNVGQNWLHDAYQQNLLVLSAFKLACEFLRKGGSFVTKVFRSKDYYKLEYVFKKLFKTVNATKPISSRYESAEIFVVCQSFHSPAKIDQEFFNPKSVFEELDPEPVNKVNIWKPAKTKVKAEGYPEGATTLYNKVPVSEFIHASNFVEVLQTASELHFEEDESLKKHKLTTEIILENCKDIKVLGRRELRQLLAWRKEIKSDLDNIVKQKEKLMKDAESEKKEGEDSEKQEKSNEEEVDEELEKIEKQLDALKYEQARSQRQKEKKSAKLKKKLMEKMRLKSLVPGDEGPTDTSRELFNLERLSKIQDIDDVVDQEATEILSDSEEEEEESRNEYIVYSKDQQRLDRTGRFWMNPGDEEIDEIEEEDEEEPITKESLAFKDDLDGIDLDDAPGSDKEDVDDAVIPLLTDLVGDSRDAKRARKANSWFNQDVFKGLENEVEEDIELDNTIEAFKKEGGIVPEKPKKQKETKTKDEGYTSDSETEVARDAPEGYSDSESDSSDSDTDTDSDSESKDKMLVQGASGSSLTNATSRKRKADEGLSAVGLSLATQMIYSKKAKRDIMDAAWNRYMFGDEDDLPHWFLADEKNYNQPRIEVEPSDLRMYRDRSKDVNAKTIKKVVEAKARKQRRTKKRMEKAKKKAEVIVNNEELSHREKAQEVNKLYKKAAAPLKKKEAQYVVMKKRGMGRKPKGIKGPYKMVDKRLKKDKRAMKKVEAKKSKNSKPKARPQKKKKGNKA